LRGETVGARVWDRLTTKSKKKKIVQQGEEI